MAGGSNQVPPWYSSDHRSSGPVGSNRQRHYVRSHEPSSGRVLGQPISSRPPTIGRDTKRKPPEDVRRETNKHQRIQPSTAADQNMSRSWASIVSGTGSSKDCPILIDLDEASSQSDYNFGRYPRHNTGGLQSITSARTITEHNLGALPEGFLMHNQIEAPRSNNLSVNGFRPTTNISSDRFQQRPQDVPNYSGITPVSQTERLGNGRGSLGGNNTTDKSHRKPQTQRASRNSSADKNSDSQPSFAGRFPRSNGFVPIDTRPANRDSNRSQQSVASANDPSRALHYPRENINPSVMAGRNAATGEAAQPAQGLPDSSRSRQPADTQLPSSNNPAPTQHAVHTSLNNPRSLPPIVLRPQPRSNDSQAGGRPSAPNAAGSRQTAITQNDARRNEANNLPPFGYNSERPAAGQDLTRNHNRITQLLNETRKRGGILPVSSLGSNSFDTPLLSGDIDHVGRDEANVLINQNRSETSPRSSGPVELGERQQSHTRAGGVSCMPRSLAALASNNSLAETTRSLSRSEQDRRRKLEPHEVTDEDWTILRLRNEGWQYPEIRAAWLDSFGAAKSDTWFRTRFSRMRETYPDLVKNARATIARNEFIARSMREHGDRTGSSSHNTFPPPDELELDESNVRTIEEPYSLTDRTPNQAIIQSSAPVSSDSSRPTTGGKYISEDLKNHILATLDCTEDDSVSESEPETSEDENWRDNSPICEEDKIHFVYHVKRRVVLNDQNEDDEIEWNLCNEAFTSISEANEAAMKEIQNPAAAEIAPLTSWNTEISEETGMIFFCGSGRKGKLEVGVHRSLRNFHDGILPENKTGWLKSDIFDAMVKQTYYQETTEYGEEVIEWGDDEVNEKEVDIDNDANIFDHQKHSPESFDDSAYASESGCDDVIDNNAEQDNNTEQNTETGSLFEEEGNTSVDELLQPLENKQVFCQGSPTKPRERGQKILLRTITRTCYITKPKTITKERTEIESPISDISAVKDRANRLAADEYLRLRKELNTDPEAKRASLKNFEAEQKAKKDMDKRLEDLEQNCENFEDTLESSQTSGGDGDNEGEPQNRESLTTKVWVKERVLLNPRNF